VIGETSAGTTSIGATRTEIAATACSDLFRDAGEILASATGVIPTIGARLARLTHAPDLLLTDGEATILADTPAVDRPSERSEGLLPYAALFELIARGRRYVVMGAPQLDRFGNQNLSAIGSHERPTRQLLGARAASTNTLNHRTSYWIPRHTQRVFVERVDFVTGVGTDRADGARFHDLHRVVTDLGVFDFSGPGGSMSVVSLHPGVELDEVVAATGFRLHLPETIAVTRNPDPDELELIRQRIDPRSTRES
jgi:acyl CoA:acetate/3-ketoacid CoA transferase beta subunit